MSQGETDFLPDLLRQIEEVQSVTRKVAEVLDLIGRGEWGNERDVIAGLGVMAEDATKRLDEIHELVAVRWPRGRTGREVPRVRSSVTARARKTRTGAKRKATKRKTAKRKAAKKR